MSTDSRAYRFIFKLTNSGDIPADFCAQAPDCFETGIFIPQDDKRWFTEEPGFPAHVLLLSGSVLHVLIHPSTAGRPFLLNIEDLVQVEVGTDLLQGWIQIASADSSCHVRYNTRASEALDNFLRLVRIRWLAQSITGPTPYCQSFGPDPDLKFGNLIKAALDHPRESVLARYFVPPACLRRRKVGFLKAIERVPGHVLLVTSTGRLVWIRDEYRGGYSRYAAITTWAPVRNLAMCNILQDGAQLEIRFVCGRRWSIRIPFADSAAAEVANGFNRLVQKRPSLLPALRPKSIGYP